MKGITPFMWFDSQAEEAATFYTSVFPDSRIERVQRYSEAGPGPAGSAMTIGFVLAGRPFVALNGGPVYQFTPAISFVVDCEDQAEVDRYWDALGDGGEHGVCGWLTDRYGVSWQVVPVALGELLARGGDGAVRVTKAMLEMQKLVIADLERAYEGGD